MELLLEHIAFQHPNLVSCIFKGNFLAQLTIIVFRAGASALAGHGESIAQHKHAEGQQIQLLGRIDNAFCILYFGELFTDA